jgi:hypothetical protein
MVITFRPESKVSHAERGPKKQTQHCKEKNFFLASMAAVPETNLRRVGGGKCSILAGT